MSENTATENTEVNDNVASAESANADNANVENPTSENTDNGNSAETEETPAYVIPDPDTIDFGGAPAKLVSDLAAQVVKGRISIMEMDALLERQQKDFADAKLMEYAENTDDEALKRMLESFNKAVRRMEQMKNELIAKVTEKIGGDKLSEEEIQAKKTERKDAAESINNMRKVLNDLSGMVPESHKADFELFLENVTVPGSRVSASSSSGSGTAAPKPRLNNGTVSVEKDNFANFPLAAKKLSSILGHDVFPVDLVRAWCDANSVSDWKDVPFGHSTFTYEGKSITVVKNEKK